MALKGDPNFTRPCWVAIYVTLGMTAVGKACLILLPFQKGPYPGLLFWLGGMLMMYVGIYGCAVSLIWWVVAAVVSSIRHRHSMQAEAKAIFPN
jgi:hypothetical protein